jgi:hypothetical protein
MLSLSKALQDHTRSFLSFKEIHKTRSVCKSWADVANVPKVLAWHSSDAPAPQASFTRITKLTMNDSNPATKFMVHQIMQQNQPHLSSIRLLWNFKLEYISFPRLEHLKSFELDNATQSVVNDIAKKAPNLRLLHIDWTDQTTKGIDLSQFPRLECLKISSAESIKNVSTSNLLKIHFTHIKKIDNVVSFLSFAKP